MYNYEYTCNINLKKINLNLNNIHNHPETVNREMSDFYLYLFVFDRNT